MHGREGALHRTEVRAALGEELKRGRERAGIPLGVAATVAGMRRQELWSCENGHKGIAAAEAVVLAAFYKISLDGLGWHRSMEEPECAEETAPATAEPDQEET